MRAHHLAHLFGFVLAFAPISILLADAPASEPSTSALATSADPATESSLRMHRLANCVYSFVWHHHNHLPAQLGDTLHAKGNRPAWFFTPADEAKHTPPSPLTANWLSQNSSWVYLASGFEFDRIPHDQRSELILFHSRLDHPFKDSAGKRFILACMVDSRVQNISLDDAKGKIDHSKSVFQSLRANQDQQK